MGSPRSRKSPMLSAFEAVISGAKKWEPGNGVVFYLVTVKPEAASQVIEHANIDNRKIRQNKVAEYSRYMVRGDWQLSSSLQFTAKGRLIDGQHRLLALRDSDVPIAMVVQVIPDSHAVKQNRYLDIGVPRNLADYLHFNGVPDSSRVAPVLVYERNYRISGSPMQSAQSEKQEYLSLYHEVGEERFKRMKESVPKGIHTNLGMNRAFIDWFALHGCYYDPETLQLFLENVDAPSGLSKSSPMFVLHQKLKDMQVRRASGKGISVVEQGALLIKAWNLNYEQKPASKTGLRYRPAEDWPQLLGEES